MQKVDIFDIFLSSSFLGRDQASSMLAVGVTEIPFSKVLDFITFVVCMEVHPILSTFF